jgi:tRNA nucleotidyltransferase (CCA-adding enzyme)
LTEAALRLPPDSPIAQLAAAVAGQGGRLLVVGGWVRDGLDGRPGGDVDLEVFGIEAEAMTRLLAPYGFTPPVGRQFPVWRQTGTGLDVAAPRGGEALFDASRPASIERAFEEAARHRDLTIDAMAWDPLDARLLDPHGGRQDLAARLLRAVDLSTFGADPLRVLRVARLAASFEASIDPRLLALCAELSLAELPAERIAGELLRMLLDPQRPSLAFEALAAMEQLEVLPPLAALRGVPQDPRWHPEGDVWVHTLLVLDRAAEAARSLSIEDRRVLLLAALCHDLGKPGTTTEEDGRIRAIRHEGVGARLTRDWLGALRLGERLVRKVAVLVAEHLAPSQLVAQGSKAKAYRRLARRLDLGGATIIELERLARADHLGRTTASALAGVYEAGETFLATARQVGVAEGVGPDVVTARDLMRAGVEAGPELGRLLDRCRALQDETGECEADRLVSRVLGKRAGGDRGRGGEECAR